MKTYKVLILSKYVLKNAAFWLLLLVFGQTCFAAGADDSLVQPEHKGKASPMQQSPPGLKKPNSQIGIKSVPEVIKSLDKSPRSGPSTGGGTGPSLVDQETIRTLLAESTRLIKNILTNYLERLDVEHISVPEVKEILAPLVRGGLLIADLDDPENYEALDSCREIERPEIAAWTKYGEFHGKICFDVPKLADYFKSMSVETAVVELASIVIHEHVHHFQSKTDLSGNLSDEAWRRHLEHQANAVAAYVKLTMTQVLATGAGQQTPSFTWIDARPEADYTHIDRDFKSGKSETKLFSGNWRLLGKYEVEGQLNTSPEMPSISMRQAGSILACVGSAVDDVFKTSEIQSLSFDEYGIQVGEDKYRTQFVRSSNPLKFLVRDDSKFYYERLLTKGVDNKLDGLEFRCRSSEPDQIICAIFYFNRNCFVDQKHIAEATREDTEHDNQMCQKYFNKFGGYLTYVRVN